ncbi:hypothetical protein [Natronomonas sp.]|uniref:hypothetical protein n=1 Tax=Natronomonas sp. TaxID=2184060 RepID=UPI003988D639
MELHTRTIAICVAVALIASMIAPPVSAGIGNADTVLADGAASPSDHPGDDNRDDRANGTDPGEGGNASDDPGESGNASDNPGNQSGDGDGDDDALLLLDSRIELGPVTLAPVIEADSVRHAVVAAEDPANNSTIATVIAVDPSSKQSDGDLVVDCTGGVAQFGCDKSGNLTLGALGVEYDGTNRVDLPGLNGGGGDNITASAGNQSVTVLDFELDSRTSKVLDVSVRAIDAHGSQNETGAPLPPDDGSSESPSEPDTVTVAAGNGSVTVLDPDLSASTDDGVNVSLVVLDSRSLDSQAGPQQTESEPPRPQTGSETAVGGGR